MNKLIVRKLTCAVVLAGAFASANATQTALGPVGIGVPVPFFGSVQPAGVFSDILTFSLPANGGSGYSVINFPLTTTGGGTFNTVLNTMSLLSDPDGIPFTPDDGLDVNVSSVTPGGNSLTLNFGPHGGGSFYLNVAGITNGTEGGLYSGAISVAAVPEAEVWAMMVVGVGLVGFQLRRKSKRAAVQRLV